LNLLTGLCVKLIDLVLVVEAEKNRTICCPVELFADGQIVLVLLEWLVFLLEEREISGIFECWNLAVGLVGNC